MRLLTCHLSHHFANMKCHSLAYKRLRCCLVGKGEAEGERGLRTAKLIMTEYQSILRMTLKIIYIRVNEHY